VNINVLALSRIDRGYRAFYPPVTSLAAFLLDVRHEREVRRHGI
jgi:hypothetical protein